MDRKDFREGVRSQDSAIVGRGRENEMVRRKGCGERIGK